MSAAQKLRIVLLVLVLAFALAPYLSWPYWVLVSCVVFGGLLLPRLPASAKAWIWITLAFCLLIAWRMAYLGTIAAERDQALAKLFTGQVTLAVQARDQVQDSGQAKDFLADSLLVWQKTSNSWQPIRAGIKIRGPSWREIQVGDIFLLQGKLQRPTNFADFDYLAYLAGKDIQALAYYPKLTWLASRAASWQRGIAALRAEIEGRINQYLPEPHASLLAGLLVGARRSFAAGLKEDFQTTGLTHIVAVSGSNVVLVILAAFFVFQWLPGLLKLPLSCLVLLAFTVLTGAEASVVRATIMGMIMLLALGLGRDSASFTALLLAALVMLWFKPQLLWLDAGFQLSFAATFGLIFLARPLERCLHFIPSHFGLRTIIACTLAAQITAGPISAYHFGNFSLIAPLANLLALPWIPPAMLFGLIMFALSYLPFLPIWFVSGPIWFLLNPIILVAQFGARLPGAAIKVSRTGSLLIFALMGVIVLVIFSFLKWKQKESAL